VRQKKIKPVKKPFSADEESPSADGDVTSAELVIVDEAMKLLQLVLRRAAATFGRMRNSPTWGNTGTTVIGRVRDSLTKVPGNGSNFLAVCGRFCPQSGAPECFIKVYGSAPLKLRPYGAI